MNLEKILENAKEREIAHEEALYLFRETRAYNETLQLFKVASEVRDEEAGRVFKLQGHIASILFSEEPMLTLEELSVAAKLIEETGTKAVMVGEGTVVGSDGKKVVDAVKAIKFVSNLDISVNVCPYLSEETLQELKNLGVKEVGSAFETTNEKLFRQCKPENNLEARKKFAETIDNIGLGLYTVLT